MLTRLREMREIIEEFYQNMLQTAAYLKAKHVKEFLQLRKLRNEILCEDDEKAETFNDFSADVRDFLRNRLGTPWTARNHAISSNPKST